jgi:hypothetical protein
MATARELLSALRRSSRFAREIALVLILKAVVLTLLFQALSHGPRPSRPLAQQRAAQRLLGVSPLPAEETHGH